MELRQADLLELAGSPAADLITFQVVLNVLMKDAFAFLRAAATTGQCSPFQPLRLFGWAPGWTA